MDNRLKDLGKPREPITLVPDSWEPEDPAMDFKDALSIIYATLSPRAEKLAQGSGRKPLACLMSIFRKELASHLGPGDNGQDNREKEWSVKIWFWDVSQGTPPHEPIAKSEEEVMQGLQAVSDAMCEYAESVHEVDARDVLQLLPEFSSLKMAKRMGGMYPAISKGGGAATLRVRYEFDGKHYVCQADISRADTTDCER